MVLLRQETSEFAGTSSRNRPAGDKLWRVSEIDYADFVGGAKTDVHLLAFFVDGPWLSDSFPGKRNFHQLVLNVLVVNDAEAHESFADSSPPLADVVNIRSWGQIPHYPPHWAI